MLMSNISFALIYCLKWSCWLGPWIPYLRVLTTAHAGVLIFGLCVSGFLKVFDLCGSLFLKHVVPDVLPFLEFVALCVQNYDSVPPPLSCS